MVNKTSVMALLWVLKIFKAEHLERTVQNGYEAKVIGNEIADLLDSKWEIFVKGLNSVDQGLVFKPVEGKEGFDEAEENIEQGRNIVFSDDRNAIKFRKMSFLVDDREEIMKVAIVPCTIDGTSTKLHIRPSYTGLLDQAKIEDFFVKWKNIADKITVGLATIYYQLINDAKIYNCQVDYTLDYSIYLHILGGCPSFEKLIDLANRNKHKQLKTAMQQDSVLEIAKNILDSIKDGSGEEYEWFVRELQRDKERHTGKGLFGYRASEKETCFVGITVDMPSELTKSVVGDIVRNIDKSDIDATGKSLSDARITANV